MKKTLAIICAVAMALSMFAVFAYTIGDGANATEFQFKVIDIRAVDFKNTLSGLNAVGSLDKNEKPYVQGDEIEVAVIFEMKNAAKFNVIPIDEDEWGGLAVFVTSSTVDFSYAPHNVVKCASDLWAIGQNQGSYNVEGGYAIASTAGRILYDSKDNMVVFGIKALKRQGAAEDTLLLPASIVTTAVPSPLTDLNIWVINHPVTGAVIGLTYDTGIFTVPAYYERNTTFTFASGLQKLTLPAPDIIEYAVIFFGRTKAPLTPSNKGELKVLSMIDAGTAWVQVRDTKDKKVVSETGWPVMKLDAGNYTIFKYKEDAEDMAPAAKATIYEPMDWLSTGGAGGYIWNVDKDFFDVGAYSLPFIAPALFDYTVGQLPGTPSVLRANLADDTTDFAGNAFLGTKPGNLLSMVGGISQVKYTFGSPATTVYLPVTGFGLTKYGYEFYPTYQQGIVATDVMDQDDLAAIVLYTVVDNNKNFPLVTLATEAGPLSVRSIAAFDAWSNRLSEDRGIFKYESVDGGGDTGVTDGSTDNGTTDVENWAIWASTNFNVGREAYRSADILKVFRTLGLNTGIEYTYKITDATFDAFIKAAVYEDLLVREYNYGTATIMLPEDEVEEGNEEEDFDEDEGEELPETGDASIAIAIMATAIIAAAALAFVLKKAR